MAKEKMKIPVKSPNTTTGAHKERKGWIYYPPDKKPARSKRRRIKDHCNNPLTIADEFKGEAWRLFRYRQEKAS